MRRLFSLLFSKTAHQTVCGGRLAFAVFLSTCLISVCNVSIAKKADDECGQIRVGLLEIGALFYRLPDGRFSGIDQDILEALSLRTNCRFKPRIESQARIWSQIRDGSLDMSMSGVRTVEREEWAISVPYFSTRNYALVSTSLSPVEQTAAGFLANKSLKMAIIKGFQHGKQYNEFVANLRQENRIYEVADFASLIKLMQVKRVQGILLIPTSYLDLSRQKQLPEATVLRDWYPNDGFSAGLYLSRKTINPRAAQTLQQAMSAMQTDGSLERIFARYVGDKLAKEMLLDTTAARTTNQ